MATSKARINANRKNALKSTGPKTAVGKARSRANSLKHGLTGEGLCLPTEDAKEVDARFDSLAGELLPQTEKELFYTRRVAMLTLRVDRCYVKEAFNLRMAVRDAIPNHDKKIFEELRINVLDLNPDPCGAFVRIRRNAEGVDWMIGHWRELRNSLAESGTFSIPELMRAEQLQGRRTDATGVFRIQELSQKCATGLERVDGECRTSPEQVEACKARCKLELAALISKEIEDLLVYRSTLPLADAELNRLEAPMRAVIDVTNAGQLLRRYESAAAREIHKIFDYFDEPRADEAAQNLNITLDPIEESVTLGSFGSRSEPEPVNAEPEPDLEPEIVVEPASNPSDWPVAPTFGPADAVVWAFEAPFRE